MEGKKLYLVTGAAGHLGSTVVAQLLERGCAVRTLCHSGTKHPPDGTEICYGDVCEKESLESFFTNSDGAEMIVIHCAGIVSISSKYEQKVYDVNVLGTKNIVDLSLQYGVRKLIYVSSVHAIPEKPMGQCMTEECTFSADAVTGLYARTKAEATAYVLAAAKHGLDAEVVFPSGIIGPNDSGHSHTNQLVLDYIEGRLGAAVRGGYDFVDVRDVADGILACADKGVSGEGYILSGHYCSVREILDILHQLTGRRAITTYLPVWFLTLMAPLCEQYYRLLRQPPLFTRYSVYTLGCNSQFSNAKALSQLGFESRDIRDTLSDTLTWLRNHGNIPT